MVWDMFPSFLELLKASLGHKNVNFNYFSIIHGKKRISCSGATSNADQSLINCSHQLARKQRILSDGLNRDAVLEAGETFCLCVSPGSSPVTKFFKILFKFFKRFLKISLFNIQGIVYDP